VQNERRFAESVAASHRVFRRRRLLEAALLGASVLLPALVAGLALGMLLRYRPVGGWIVPISLAVGLAAGAWAAIRFGLRHHLNREEFLRHLERRLGLRENDLVNAAEMESRLAGMEDPLSRGLAGLAVDGGRSVLAGAPIAKLAPALPLRPSGLRIAGSVAVGILLFLAGPAAFLASASRLASPGSYDLPPALVIQVQPGNLTVERGTSVLVRAHLAQGRPDGAPELLYRAPGGAWKRAPMAAADPADGDGAGGADPAGPGVPAERTEAAAADGALDPAGVRDYRATLPAVLEATEYAVASGRAQSETYRIRVIDALRATGYRHRVEFPAYTGLAPIQDLAADGNLSALLGSRVTLLVYPSRPGARGRLVPDEGAPIPLEPAGKEELVATLPVRGSLDYRVELTSSEVEGARWMSDRFTLEAVADRMPVLFQLGPEQSIVLPPELAVNLELDCMDDYGLTRLDLVWRRNDEEPRRVRVAAWQDGREARVSWPWDLEDVGLIPGEVIRYHLELTDNDAVTGPKTTIGPEGEIRLPSFDEMYAALDEDRGDQLKEAREALERQENVAEDLKSALQEMRRDKKLDWEQQEQVKELAARQEEVARQVEDLAQAMERSLERMEQGSLFSPEILEKVAQINELVREIEDPAFREQLRKLQEAIQNLDKKAIQKAMENLQLTQEELARNLDRTIQMLQQLQREENLDRMIQQAEQMLEEQKRINEQLAAEQPKPGEKREPAERPSERSGEDPSGEKRSGETQEPRPDETGGERREGAEPESGEERQLSPEESARLQERQQALREELEKLREQMAALQKEAEKNWQELQERMQEQQAQQQLASAQQNMQDAQQSMQQQQRKSGLKFGRQAEQDLQNFAQGMRQAQSAMNGAEQEELARQLYALSGNLVGISQEQEELLRTAPARSTRELALEQQRLAEGARRNLDELYKLAQQSRFINGQLARSMGEAVRSLEAAQRDWMDGRRPGGMQSGKAAGGAIDETVLSLLNAGQSMCNSGQASSCSNPLARLRSLGGQQEQLNQDAQQMMGSMPNGQRLSSGSGQGERLLQMAARQQAIRQGLAELEQAMQNQDNVLGRLGDIGSEMEEVVQEMRRRGLDERVLRRQERILSRLLTAQRSLRKEGQKEERISRTGVNPLDRTSPAAYVGGPSEREALQRGILRGSQDPVPGDFRRLVETYFRSLGAQP